MKYVVQPTSRSLTMESNTLDAYSLKMYTLVAYSGKSGMFRLQVYNGYIVPLFSRSIYVQVSVRVMFVTGIEICMS